MEEFVRRTIEQFLKTIALNSQANAPSVFMNNSPDRFLVLFVAINACDRNRLTVLLSQFSQDKIEGMYVAVHLGVLYPKQIDKEAFLLAHRTDKFARDGFQVSVDGFCRFFAFKIPGNGWHFD